MSGRALRISTEAGKVSGLVTGPSTGPTLVLGHGAGGDMRGAFLEAFAVALAGGGIRCLRFNFAYREEGRRAPDREPVLRQVWAGAFERASGEGPVWAGGKSLGGRIASLAVADGMPAAGLVFLGYPLHPPGKPERLRDAHLPRIRVPMLFLQGTADPFARWHLLESTIAGLGRRATLHPVEGGDHSFRVRGRPRDDEGMAASLAAVAAGFILG